MRTSVFIVAALAAFASPAFAQDRTLPAGSYMAAQPPIDTIGVQPVETSAPALEGRSIGQDVTPVVSTRSRHRS